MMLLKKKIFFLSIAVCFSSHAFAQVMKTDSLSDTIAGKTDNQAGLHKQNGFFNNTQAGIGVRLGAPVFSISTVNGYQFTRHFSLGFGAGYTHVNYPLWAWRNWQTGHITRSEYKVSSDLFDLFIQPRIFIGKQKMLPILFFMFDIGYSFCFNPKEHSVTPKELQDWFNKYHESYSVFDSLVTTSYRGGVYGAPGIGLKTYIHRNISLNFSLQLIIATYSIKETTRYASNEYSSTGSFLIYLYPLFKIGIGFQ
ncbi:MAG: hypothetical protein NTW16_16090 [Bacteroidetes bacterium]|nr:hypothetical protein [Bacteroidota bacterium]